MHASRRPNPVDFGLLTYRISSSINMQLSMFRGTSYKARYILIQT